jgi:sugar lactone lactonase YvrE
MMKFSRRSALSCLRVLPLLAAILLGLAATPGLRAQGDNASSVYLSLTPDGSEARITFNEVVSAAAWIRDGNEAGIAGATVSFSVDGGTAVTETTDATGLAYVNLGQLSIANHKVTASYAGNATYGASTQSQTFEVFDAAFQFVGTQGTTLFVDGSVSGAGAVAVDPQDNLYVSDSAANVVKKEDGLGNVTTIPFTGLKNPIGLAIDSQGNVYLADSGNNRILEYTTSGKQSVVPVTGLNGPTYLAYDRNSDLLYVADPKNQRIVSYDTTAKATTTVVTGLKALRSIAVETDGYVLYADAQAGFFKVYGATQQIPLFGAVKQPGGIAAGPNNSVILSDQSTNNIFRLDGSGTQVQINQGGNPAEGMAVDSKGRVYLALGGRVDVLAPGSGRLADVGVSTTSEEYAIYQLPKAEPSFTVAATPATVFSNIRKGSCLAPTNSCFDIFNFSPLVAGVNGGSLTTTVGDTKYVEALWGNGIGATGAFAPGVPSQNSSDAGTIGGLGLDAASNTYIADSKNNTVTEVAAVTAAKTTLKFTGLSKPTQLATDGAGSVYVLDSGNERIERMDAAGNQADAYAPSGESLNVVPSAFAVDGEGNLVIAGVTNHVDASPQGGAENVLAKKDGLTGKARRARANDSGSGNYSVYFIGNDDSTGFKLPFPVSLDIADGLNEIAAVAIDSAGKIYAADTGGTLTRYGSDGSSKTLASGLGSPVAISVDASETVYVAVANSSVIHVVHSDGSTGTLSVPALSNPASLAVNSFGNVVTADATTLQLLYLDRTRQRYDFGNVQVGKLGTLHGSLTNIGNQPFTIEGTGAGTIPADNEFIQVSSTTQCSQGGIGEPAAPTIAPNASCDLSYEFLPITATTYTDSGTIPTKPAIFASTSPGGGKISLSGTGVTGSGGFTITPSKIVFGNTAVGGKSATMTATISNTTLVGVYLGKGSLTDGTDFTQSDNCFSFVNANNGSCTVTFTFTPKTSGALASTYSIYDLDNPANTLTVALSGNGSTAAAAQAALTPTSGSFGSVTVGASSASQTFTLTNAGTAALSITSAGLTGTNATSFSIVSNACGTSLAAGKSCAIAVKFSPTAAASDSATLSVVDAVGTQSAALTGTGTAAAAAKASLTPTSAAYGSVGLGVTSAGKVFTLTNGGNAALPITSISVTGANIYSFALSDNTCKSPLAAGASCAITISFAPTASGAATATLTVIDSVGTQTATLTGTGVSAPATTPAATLTPATLDFGSVVNGTTSKAMTATLKSTGTAALAISSIQVTGTNAAVFASTNTCGSSLAIGATCTISVTFGPTATGSDTAQITVADNAAGSPQTVALSGTATAPVVAADFTIAATPATQSVTAGASANYAINLGSSGSTFADAVQLTVSGLPAGAVATFTPASLTPGALGAASTSSAMSIQTAAFATNQQASQSPGRSPWPVTAGVVSAALFLLPFKKRKRLAAMLTFAGLAVLALTSLTACGGGFALPTQPVPPATYTLTVTGTGTGTSSSLQHSTTVQITVR